MTSGASNPKGHGIAGYATGADAPLRATEQALQRIPGAPTLILVEGISDQIAIETLAIRLGLRLEHIGAVVVPIGGATAIDSFVQRFARPEVRLLGLCDVGEEPHYSLAFGSNATKSGSTFFVCDADLEDELIRGLGLDAAEEVLSGEGELGAFRTLQKQAAWRDQSFDAQMSRWLGAGSLRKSRYAKLFVNALDDERIPTPLLELFDAIES